MEAEQGGYCNGIIAEILRKKSAEVWKISYEPENPEATSQLLTIREGLVMASPAALMLYGKLGWPFDYHPSYYLFPPSPMLSMEQVLRSVADFVQ